MAGHRHWIRNADVVVTMDAARRELAGANIVAVEGPIASVGAGGPEDRAGWEVIDTAGCVVTAFGNAHQHLFQTLTRAVTACQDPLLFGWLEAGKRADLATWDVSGLNAAGGWDPVAALVLCGPFTVRDLLVEGCPVVRDRMLTTVDPVAVVEAAGRSLTRLVL